MKLDTRWEKEKTQNMSKYKGCGACFEDQTCRWTAQKTLIKYNYVSADKYW